MCALPMLRLPLGLLAALMPWLVIAIARHLGARGAHAWHAGSLAVLLPLLAGLGVMAMPDVPLTLAILLCVEAVLALLTRFSAAALPIGRASCRESVCQYV